MRAVESDGCKLAWRPDVSEELNDRELGDDLGIRRLRLQRCEISGYRALRHLSVELRGLNVLIGINGSGKTSFLDIFSLLAEGARGDLRDAIRSRGGFDSLLSRFVARGKSQEAFQVELQTAPLPGKAQQTYRLRLATRGTGYQIDEETLSSESTQWLTRQEDRARYNDGERQIAPTWDFKGQELALAQTSREYAEIEWFRTRLAEVAAFGALDVGPSAPIRLPQNLDPSRRLPGSNGRDLISALYNLRAADDPAYERILDAIRAGFPGFQGLEFPLTGAGKATLLWRERGLREGCQAYELSEGTLRFLWLVTILLSPDRPDIVLIDEPEVSLHPELLKLLSGILQESAEHSQIFVATHSDRLLRWLEPGDLVILDRDESGTVARRGDDPGCQRAQSFSAKSPGTRRFSFSKHKKRSSTSSPPGAGPGGGRRAGCAELRRFCG